MTLNIFGSSRSSTFRRSNSFSYTFFSVGPRVAHPRARARAAGRSLRDAAPRLLRAAVAGAAAHGLGLLQRHLLLQLDLARRDHRHRSSRDDGRAERDRDCGQSAQENA
jgi:hypothetical protein